MLYIGSTDALLGHNLPIDRDPSRLRSKHRAVNSDDDQIVLLEQVGVVGLRGHRLQVAMAWAALSTMAPTPALISPP